jgi:hypothetical protein
MVQADPVMRAARNGFGAVMVALLLVYVYTVGFTETANQRLFDIWLVGAAVYWLSQLYYKRQPSAGGSE